MCIFTQSLYNGIVPSWIQLVVGVENLAHKMYIFVWLCYSSLAGHFKNGSLKIEFERGEIILLNNLNLKQNKYIN